MNKYISLSKDVKAALENNKPVIALESTIISHGMPYPQNMEVARELENIAMESGVIPATIAIIDGKLKAGLSNDELKTLATADNVSKVSLRDISKILINRSIGATTVAATMFIANLAGIKVFATGGIGGVHRFVSDTMDVSADMTAFSQIPVIVVTAGAKAILDLEKTIEYLETLGVPLYGYKTDEFPAFYTSSSGIKIERIDDEKDIADIFSTNTELGLKTGMIVANPIPQKYEIGKSIMDKTILTALEEMKNNGIIGKKVTPYLLSKIVELTHGESLKANIELVKNNVRLACRIAKQF